MYGLNDRSMIDREIQKLSGVASGEDYLLVVMMGLALVVVLWLLPQVVMVALVVSPYLLPFYFPHPISNPHSLSHFLFVSISFRMSEWERDWPPARQSSNHPHGHARADLGWPLARAWAGLAKSGQACPGLGSLAQ